MHILQFNYVRRIHRLGLLLLAFIVFNPILSFAEPQAPISEENVTVAISTSNKNLLVVGDSLSAAYGLDIQQGWVSLLQSRYTQLNVINASISGETTSGGKQRLASLLEKHQPDILILELGANDALRGQDLNVSQANLQQMIEACPQFNQACKVILLGVQLPTNYGPVYDALFQKMYQNLAEKNALLFDPFFLEPVALDPDLMQWDGLHPNAEAQPVILERIAPLVERAVKDTEGN